MLLTPSLVGLFDGSGWFLMPFSGAQWALPSLRADGVSSDFLSWNDGKYIRVSLEGQSGPWESH